MGGRDEIEARGRRQVSQIPMPWSLGPVGDLVWVYLPSSRPRVIELAIERMHFDLDDDSPLHPVSGFDLLTLAANPVIRNALGSDDDRTGRTEVLRFLWELLTYQGSEASVVRYEARVYLVDWLMIPPFVEKLREANPKLVDMIIREFGDHW